MKTEFTKLPKGVQEFINREGLGCYFFDGEISLKMLHTLKEWSKATDEERLAYAYWKYPRGVKFIDQETNGALTSAGESFSIAWFYDFKTHKWAEIIEEKEEKIIFNSSDISDLDKKEIERMLKESVKTPFILSNPEPIFKAGDEVEYQGSTISKVIHVFDGMAWIKNADQKYGSLVDLSNLRKPDPDKVYREIAKEFLREKVYSFDNLEHFTVPKQGLIELIIEAIKKGKEL